MIVSNEEQCVAVANYLSRFVLTAFEKKLTSCDICDELKDKNVITVTIQFTNNFGARIPIRMAPDLQHTDVYDLEVLRFGKPYVNDNSDEPSGIYKDLYTDELIEMLIDISMMRKVV